MNVIALKKTHLPAGEVPRLAFVGIIIFALLLLAYGFSNFMSPRVEAKNIASANTSGKVFLSSAAATADVSLEEKQKAMNIANNGFILLRNARVISISSDAIVAEIAWGSQDFEWKVKIDYNTKFVNSKGEKGKLADIQEGSAITVTGDLDASAGEPTIAADYVRY